jgi:trk system potassium uptake protein TrkA
MRAVIVGCGRVGAGLADRLARAGHDVTVLDISTDAFARLPTDFPGSAIRGDGTDEDTLRRAGAQGADLFAALTEGDNRNVLAAQLANETFGIREVIAKVNDPVRAEAYTTLGISTICRTTILIEALARFAGLSAEDQQLGVARATGHHRGGEHHGARLSPNRIHSAGDGQRQGPGVHTHVEARTATSGPATAAAGRTEPARTADAAGQQPDMRQRRDGARES